MANAPPTVAALTLPIVVPFSTRLLPSGRRYAGADKATPRRPPRRPGATGRGAGLHWLLETVGVAHQVRQPGHPGVHVRHALDWCRWELEQRLRDRECIAWTTDVGRRRSWPLPSSVYTINPRGIISLGGSRLPAE